VAIADIRKGLDNLSLAQGGESSSSPVAVQELAEREAEGTVMSLLRTSEKHRYRNLQLSSLESPGPTTCIYDKSGHPTDVSSRYCPGGGDTRSVTVSSAVCEKGRKLEPMSVRPEQKEKGQVFIDNLGAGVVANKVRFKSLVMERCPGPTFETTDLLAQNPDEAEPETYDFTDFKVHPDSSTHRSHSFANLEDGMLIRFESRENDPFDSGSSFFQNENHDFSPKSGDFSTKQSKGETLIDGGLKLDRNSPNGINDQLYENRKKDLLSRASQQVVMWRVQAFEKTEEIAS
jgi:hypothetical protein